MKIFLMSFTLFLSAYLWATTFTLRNEIEEPLTSVNSGQQCENDSDNDDNDNYAGCVTALSDFCGTFTSHSDDQCFEKSVNACHNDISSDCVKDMALYCDYNTSFSNNQCWQKAVNACDGNPAAMREISEASKEKSLNAVQNLSL